VQNQIVKSEYIKENYEVAPTLKTRSLGKESRLDG